MKVCKRRPDSSSAHFSSPTTPSAPSLTLILSSPEFSSSTLKMKSTAPFALLASALTMSAAPVALQAAELEPCQANPYAVAFISSSANALVSKAVDEAMNVIGDISDWNSVRILSSHSLLIGLTDQLTLLLDFPQVREKFTKKTTCRHRVGRMRALLSATTRARWLAIGTPCRT